VDEDGKRLEIETIYADNAKSVKKINRSDQLVTAKSFDVGHAMLVYFTDSGNGQR